MGHLSRLRRNPPPTPDRVGLCLWGSWTVTIVEPQLDDAADLNVPGGTIAVASSDETLRSIRARAEETKRKSVATLLHNRYDCLGMAAIMCATTLGLGHTLNPSKWVMDPHDSAPLCRLRSVAEPEQRTSGRADHAARIKARRARPLAPDPAFNRDAQTAPYKIYRKPVHIPPRFLR